MRVRRRSPSDAQCSAFLADGVLRRALRLAVHECIRFWVRSVTKTNAFVSRHSERCKTHRRPWTVTRRASRKIEKSDEGAKVGP